MLESLTADVFSARIGDRFRLHVTPDETIEVELVEATVLGARPGRRVLSVLRGIAVWIRREPDIAVLLNSHF